MILSFHRLTERAEALNAGADRALSKPFSSTDLCRVIDELTATNPASGMALAC